MGVGRRRREWKMGREHLRKGKGGRGGWNGEGGEKGPSWTGVDWTGPG